MSASPAAPNPYGRAHKNYTFATVSATADAPIYAEAFGIPESHVIPTGVPRVDPFFDPAHREAAREAALDAFPAARGRFTILFAPTFRGNGARSAAYDLGCIDLASLHALCVEKDAVCIIRMHPFVRAPLRIPDDLRDRLIDGSTAPIEVNDLLFAVDLLVTDYSSIVYEHSILGRPVLFYAYDLEEYIASRDFYEPYESFVPGRIVRTFDELLDAIRRDEYELEKVAAFASPPLRPPRRRLDGPGHRPDPLPVKGLRHHAADPGGPVRVRRRPASSRSGVAWSSPPRARIASAATSRSSGTSSRVGRRPSRSSCSRSATGR